ncbi:MAG: hypothetical protein P4L84_03910 [Isosphaeraceae bacterium]|nr:hypothetical protein [Isosphaeraceae bacterium]
MPSLNLLSTRHPGHDYPACPLCGGCVYLGEPCGHCHAPAEVIGSIAERNLPARFVGVLGPSGVGKTVYLGMLLDLLARGAGGLHGLPRGPFSMEVHRNLVLSLERQRFPEKTPVEPDRWKWVHCEVSRGTKRGQVYDIVTPDVAGEAVLNELMMPRSSPTVRSLIGRCAGLVVLVDTLQVIEDGQGQELFAMQLISYLSSLRPTRRHRMLELPVALVFTKADLCEDAIHDPEGFAKTNATGLWKLCESRLRHFRFFGAAVAGSTAMLVDRDGGVNLIPLRVEPRGVIEPFAWLLAQL